MSEALITLGGVVVGGALTFLVQFWLRRDDRRVRQAGWRQAACVEILSAVHREREIIAKTAPVVELGQPMTPPLTDDERLHVTAMTRLHASKELNALLDEWSVLRTKFFAAAGVREELLRGSTPDRAEAREAYRELNELRTHIFRDVVPRIEARARRDLGLDD